MRYETEETQFGTNIRKITEDNKVYFIPLDPNNSDYQAYLNKDKQQVEHLTEIVPGDE